MSAGGQRTPLGVAAGAVDPSLGALANMAGPMLAALLSMFGAQMPGMGRGTPMLGAGGSARVRGTARDQYNINQILGGPNGVTGQDSARMANVLRSLGLENVNPGNALSMLQTGQSVLGGMFPSLGPTAITDLMGGMSSDFAKQLYRGSSRVRGRSGWRLSNQEIQETTNLVSDRASSGPGGGIDFNYTKGMTLGEIGEIGAEMGGRGMLGYDPARAGSVAEQVERDTKNMIDTVDELRGLWDAPDAPINKLMSRLDDMLGGSAVGMGTGSLKSLVKNISATAQALGVESKQMMASLMDAGQRGQQAGIGGAMGVQMGMFGYMGAESYRRTSSAGREASSANIGEDDMRQLLGSSWASGSLSESQNLMVGLIRHAQAGGVSTEGGSGDSRRFRKLLAEPGNWSDDDLRFMYGLSPDIQRQYAREGGVSDQMQNLLVGDKASNFDTMEKNPGVAAAAMQGQLEEEYKRLAAATGDADGFGAARGADAESRQRREEIFRRAGQAGVNNAEAMQRIGDELGIKDFEGARAFNTYKAAYANDETYKQTTPAHLHAYQHAQGKHAAVSDASGLQAEITATKATNADIEDLFGLNNSAAGPKEMIQRFLSQIQDPNSDSSADGLLKGVTNTPDMDKLATGGGMQDILGKLAGVEQRLARFREGDRLSGEISKGEESLKTYREAGRGDTEEAKKAQQGVIDNRKALDALGDVSSPEARRQRTVLEAGQRHYQGVLQAGFGEGGIGGGVAQEYATAQKGAEEARAKLDELDKRLEEQSISEEEYRDEISNIEKSTANATGAVEKNFGAGARANVAEAAKAAVGSRDGDAKTYGTNVRNLVNAVSGAGAHKDAVETPQRILDRVSSGDLSAREAAELMNKHHGARVDTKAINSVDDLREATGKLAEGEAGQAGVVTAAAPTPGEKEASRQQTRLLDAQAQYENISGMGFNEYRDNSAALHEQFGADALALFRGGQQAPETRDGKLYMGDQRLFKVGGKYMTQSDYDREGDTYSANRLDEAKQRIAEGKGADDDTALVQRQAETDFADSYLSTIEPTAKGASRFGLREISAAERDAGVRETERLHGAQSAADVSRKAISTIGGVAAESAGGPSGEGGPSEIRGRLSMQDGRNTGRGSVLEGDISIKLKGALPAAM